MRALFLFLAVGFVVFGAVNFQAHTLDELNATFQVSGYPISYLGLLTSVIAAGFIILLMVTASYRRALRGRVAGAWYISEIVIGGAAALVLYVFADNFRVPGGACYNFASPGVGNGCVKAWAYFLVWIAAGVPVTLGIVGYIQSLNFGGGGKLRQLLSSLKFKMPAGAFGVEKEGGGYAVRIASLPHLVIGALIGLFLLVFVHGFELFGSTCYYVGSFTVGGCYSRWIYYAGWLAAIGLVAWGIFGRGKSHATG